MCISYDIFRLLSRFLVMKGFERKHHVQKARHVVFSLPVLGVLGVATLCMCVAVWNIYQKERATRDNLQQVMGVYEVLQNRERELTASVDSLKKPFGVESEIRKKFGYVKAGEEQIIIVDDPAKKSENEEVPQEKSWWQKVKDIF